MAVWGWKDGCFSLISPAYPEDKNGSKYRTLGEFWSQRVRLDDIDQDGSAEIIVSPKKGHHWEITEDGNNDINWFVRAPGECCAMTVQSMLNGMSLTQTIQILSMFHRLGCFILQQYH